jgi:hypothetical protein
VAESVTPRSLPDGDKIVRRLDLFPELLQALRDGDLLTGRLFCAQLFDFDTGRSSLRAELAYSLVPRVRVNPSQAAATVG